MTGSIRFIFIIFEEHSFQLLVKERKLFPCFFGSALKVCGVDVLLSGLSKLMKEFRKVSVEASK